MKKINYFIFTIFLFILTSFSAQAENKILNIGDKNAKITVKVFSSLTCPHCANFHNNIFEKLKEKYIDMQNQILNERIEAQKKYNIQSTPTIFINEKKYEGKHEYKSFDKEIKKLL